MFDLSEHLKDLTDIQKIAVTQWVMKHIVEHATEGGSYRYLIYERLGFGTEAYAPLCDDGLTISNEFDLTKTEKIQKFFSTVFDNSDAYLKHKFEGFKKDFAICDEPNCVRSITCGWPSETGYRSTCGDHFKSE
jgi:hypothetical protein